MYNILHIMPNDGKFILGAREYFNSPCLTNVWIQRDYHVDNLGDCIELDQWSKNSFDVAVVHFMNANIINTLRTLNSTGRIHVQFFGGDYMDAFDSLQTLDPEQYKALHPQSIWNLVPRSISSLRRFKNWKNSNLWKALDQIDSYSTCLGEIENLLFPGIFREKRAHWRVNYQQIDDIFTLRSEIIGNNIILGNSATPTNNHISALILLSKLRDKFETCYIPLSYGIPEYRNKIISLSKELLGDQAVPILEFLPMESYQDLIGSSKYIILPHIRQQAVGNALSAIAAGATLILNTHGVNAQFFQSKGIHFKTLNDVERYGLTEISSTEVSENQKSIRQIWTEHINHPGMLSWLEKL